MGSISLISELTLNKHFWVYFLLTDILLIHTYCTLTKIRIISPDVPFCKQIFLNHYNLRPLANIFLGSSPFFYYSNLYTRTSFSVITYILGSLWIASTILWCKKLISMSNFWISKLFNRKTKTLFLSFRSIIWFNCLSTRSIVYWSFN